MNNRYQTTLAAELPSLPIFRRFIKTVCKDHSEISDQDCYDIQLAVDEACTNVIIHGYAGLNPGSIILTIQFEVDQISIIITDFGHSFEPAAAPQPDVNAALEDRPVGGFGLFFIYQTMDQVDYETSEGGNKLKFIKRLQPVDERL